MLFIQVFCVFTFLVFCLDFYLYNRESLKTKIITVEFFGFYSIFCVFFFFRVWVNILLPLVCFLFSVYVYLEWMGVYVCVLQHYQTFVLVLMQFCSEGVSYSFFSRREFSCVFVWVCFCLWVFIVSANKLGKQENTRTIKQPINGLWQKRKANWHWHTSNCQTIQSEIVYRKRMNQRKCSRKERKENFAYITFFVVNATFVLRIPHDFVSEQNVRNWFA